MAVRILVTDGENRSALAVTRSLGTRGCQVLVTHSCKQSLASSSRHCWQSFQTPDPVLQGPEYSQSIMDLVRGYDIDFIFPITDASIYWLNKVRDILPKSSTLACPSNDLFEVVSNKSKLCQLAQRCSVCVPGTIYLSSRNDLPECIDKITTYPVVIKPAMSKVLEKGQLLSGCVRYASSPAELEELYTTYEVLKHPSMIQEKVVGPGTAIFTLFDGNEHLALFSHQRILEKPPSGGVSVLSQSVPLDQEMVDSAARLLKTVGWQGIAMVEFKRDLRDGKPRLMEINGRFWGSLQLAIACGVDFPVLYLDYLSGRDVQCSRKDYIVGHKLRWSLGMFDHLLIRLRHNDMRLKLPGNVPSLFQVLKELCNVFDRQTSEDVFDRTDVRPQLVEAYVYLCHIIGSKGSSS
ncbi:carboxylate--amine ligase [Geomonas azotofigens]|uniref:carboxylate--amine ligase n=1 Tax=Geomonas azotofigens TaxID=2843196 RepID=UPI001C11A5C8|nr:ATP-grasp domain-containing protein [Geomonas azotofigens]MBU5613499.1 ATP-grasp domain-containing protein [Geomonas azotofigens]